MGPAEFRIGIVGVGRMGANMARRLHDLNYQIVALYDTEASRAETLAKELGSKAVPTPAQVADPANTILTVVPDDASMRHIYAPGKPESLLRHATNRLFINCATLSPAVQTEVHALVEGQGARASKPVWRAAFPRPAKAPSISCVVDDETCSSARPRY